MIMLRLYGQRIVIYIAFLGGWAVSGIHARHFNGRCYNG